jgi:hypothetical protein
MNVLNIPKQIDLELVYSYHAIQRAEERKVPLPKYLPLNAKCVDTKIVNNEISYTVEYIFNNSIYTMILSHNGGVITVYPEGRKNFISYNEETYLLWLIRLNKKQAKIYEKQQSFNITSVSKLLTKRRLSFNESLLLYDISQAEKQKETFIKRCA